MVPQPHNVDILGRGVAKVGRSRLARASLARVVVPHRARRFSECGSGGACCVVACWLDDEEEPWSVGCQAEVYCHVEYQFHHQNDSINNKSPEHVPLHGSSRNTAFHFTTTIFGPIATQVSILIAMLHMDHNLVSLEMVDQWECPVDHDVVRELEHLLSAPVVGVKGLHVELV
eukprot:4029528-Karenia_brevis.AAC.1